jgi:hypothetical protein
MLKLANLRMPHIAREFLTPHCKQAPLGLYNPALNHRVQSGFECRSLTSSSTIDLAQPPAPYILLPWYVCSSMRIEHVTILTSVSMHRNYDDNIGPCPRTLALLKMYHKAVVSPPAHAKCCSLFLRVLMTYNVRI